MVTGTGVVSSLGHEVREGLSQGLLASGGALFPLPTNFSLIQKRQQHHNVHGMSNAFARSVTIGWEAESQ